VRCDQLGVALSSVAAGEASLGRREQAHVERCLRCQAELVQHRRVLASLRSLRHELLQPAPGLVGEVLAAIEEVGERSAVRSLVRRRRVAYLGGLAAATAAGATGAIWLAVQSRRGRAEAG